MKNVADKLNTKLKPNSLLILGDFDKNSNIENLISGHFVRVDEKNVFKKI